MRLNSHRYTSYNSARGIFLIEARPSCARPSTGGLIYGKEKSTVVYGAIVSNLRIAILKYIVAFITHSSAMIAEAIRSTADTGNEIPLLLEMHRS